MCTVEGNVKKVPKGTSSYQAAWIVDEEGDQGEGNSEDDDDDDVIFLSHF